MASTARAKTTTPTWNGETVTNDALFECLREATAARHVDRILDQIGALRAASLDKVVGGGYRWQAFGDNPSNVSTIGLGANPGKALIERVTNAIDAVIERERPKGKKLPTSPREAVKEWFGRPETGPDTGLFNWKYGNVDEKVRVHIRPSDGEYPTVDVEDQGIGIQPEDFPKTILSLQAGNKLTKLYLAGTFGQGGSASIAFSKYVIVWSRHKDWTHKTGFTVIRELELGSEYKENAYAYLTDENGHVMWVDSPTDGEAGTTVRHIEYKMEKQKLGGTLISSPGNLYHAFNAGMFDTMLPFRVIDHRDFKRSRDEVVRGSRNRLMRETGAAMKEVGTNIVHHHPMEYLMVGDAMKEPTLGLEYWVVLSRRKSGVGDNRVILRPQSNELFVNNNYPLVATVNGQVHGEQSAKFLRDMGLPLLSKHIVIHLDASRVNARLRRDLFATTREGFKDGPLLSEVMEKVETILKADDKLFDLEQQLADRIVSSENAHTSSEVKAQVVKLLTDAGWPGAQVGPRKVKGKGREIAQALSAEGSGEGTGGGSEALSEAEPFIAAPFPEVNQFEPAIDVLELPQGKAKVVQILSDASREFADRGLVALRSEPEGMAEVLSFSAPKSGGFMWRVQAGEAAKVGDTFALIASLTKPNGEQLQASVVCAVVEPLKDKSEEGSGSVPDFEVIAVSPRDAEAWSMVWPELPPDNTPEERLVQVAYRPLKVGDGLFVYYSTVFQPFAELREKYAHRGPLVNAYQSDFEVFTAYHAITQYLDDPLEGLDTEMAERLAEAERTRFGKVQSKQSWRSANLRIAADKAEKVQRAGAE